MATLRDAAVAFARQSRDKNFLRRIAGAGIQAEREALVPTRYVYDAYPAGTEIAVPMGDMTLKPSNMDAMEIYAISVLLLVRKPRTIFEFGTFDGATTLRLAELAPDAEIVTIDLPETESESLHLGTQTGARFLGTSHEARITQLRGDSRTFDFSAYRDKMDLVVIDAGHDYAAVSADTQNAALMLTDTGAIVWDDYVPKWTDVVRAVDEFAADARPRPFKVAGSESVIWDRQLTT